MWEPINAETAHQNLQYIRRTLEAAGRFTAVPGKGLMTAGTVALTGVAINVLWTGAPWAQGPLRVLALDIWGIVLGASLAAVAYSMFRKAQQMNLPVSGLMLRRLLWSFCPALFLGTLLTILAVRSDQLEWLPTIWLGCYGAAVTNGGLVSVTPVRTMGLCLLATAAGAAFSPPDLGLVWLAVGFGWLHLTFGAYIAWRHHG